jgi:hypothetical protein
MLDDRIVPFRTTLMSKHNKVSRHRSIRALLHEDVAFLGALSKRSLGEVDVINVGTFSLCWGILHGSNGNEQKQHENQRANAFHSSLQVFVVDSAVEYTASHSYVVA